MRAGLLDRRIALQQFTLATDGDPTSGSWRTEDTVWAQKMEQRQVEQVVSEREAAAAVRAYRIRYREDVDPTWRVTEGNEIWGIIGTPEGEGRKTETVLLCERHDPDDE